MDLSHLGLELGSCDNEWLPYRVTVILRFHCTTIMIIRIHM